MSEIIINFFSIVQKTFEDIIDYRLNKKSHIIKYYQVRKFYNEIADNMKQYFDEGKYDMDSYYSSVLNNIKKETKGYGLHLNKISKINQNVLYELFLYRNHNKIPSVSEIYSVIKRFRNKEKLKMLDSIINSYVGLFRIVDVNKWNGFVTYEDVFTFKKFKIIDIAMSKTLRLNKNMSFYIYNRVISYDGISFAIGIDNVMSSSNERLQKFIDKHNYNKCSDFSRCLILHNISKDEKNLDVEYDCW